MLDDLHEYRRVKAPQPLVHIGQCGLDQSDPLPRPVGQPVQPQPALRQRQRPNRHVRTDDLGVTRVFHQVAEQGACAAAQIQHPCRARLREHRQHRFAALGVQRHALDLRRQLRLLVGGVSLALRGALRHRVRNGVGQQLGQAGLGLTGQDAAVRQKPTGDQPALGMSGQPAVAFVQERVDLIRGHPVMLGVIKHRQQHIEMVQRICQAQRPGQRQIDVPALTPLRERRIQRHRRADHIPTQRREQRRSQRHATLAAQRRHTDLQRDRRRGQLRAILGLTPRGGAEHPVQRR